MIEFENINDSKYSFKIYYPKKRINTLYFLSVFIPAIYGVLFLLLWLFPKDNRRMPSDFDKIMYLVIIFISLLGLFSVLFFTAVYYKKTTVDVTYGTIYYRTLFFEKEFLFSDITDIYCYASPHPESVFKKRYHLITTICFGKRKIKLNTNMVNAKRFTDLLIERGYLKNGKSK